jgi:hypothetical protein
VLKMFGQQHKYSGNISSLKSFGDILAEAGKLIERFDSDMATIPMVWVFFVWLSRCLLLTTKQDDPTKCPKAKVMHRHKTTPRRCNN